MQLGIPVSTQFFDLLGAGFQRVVAIGGFAGPAANLLLILVAIGLIKLGLTLEYLTEPGVDDHWMKLVGSTSGGFMEGVAWILSIFFFLNVRGKNSPRSSMVAAYAAATGRRPPKDLSRRRPSSYLGNCVLEVETVTVVTDEKGQLRSEVLHYSRVKRVVRRTAGTPPCLESLANP